MLRERLFPESVAAEREFLALVGPLLALASQAKSSRWLLRPQDAPVIDPENLDYVVDGPIVGEINDSSNKLVFTDTEGIFAHDKNKRAHLNVSITVVNNKGQWRVRSVRQHTKKTVYADYFEERIGQIPDTERPLFLNQRTRVIKSMTERIQSIGGVKVGSSVVSPLR